MRKFLYEYDFIVTMEELQFYYNESTEKAEKTFNQYLEECLSKNGSLVEIKTKETPKYIDSVTLYRVAYSDGIDDTCDMWLTDSEAEFQRSIGNQLAIIREEC